MKVLELKKEILDIKNITEETQPTQTRQLLRVIELEKSLLTKISEGGKISVNADFSEEPQPTILVLVKFIAHQTCISPMQIRKLVRVLELKTIVIDRFSEEPQPSILAEALTAPDPEALAIQAIEEGWTAKQVREEVAKLIAEEPQPFWLRLLGPKAG